MHLIKTQSKYYLLLSSVIILIIGILLSATTPVSAKSIQNGPSDPNEVSSFIDGVMATSMENNHVPGAVVVVVKDGEVFFAKGYGYADLENKIPVDPATTLFRPGSVSKLFTWTAIMQLVEAGKLDLDSDVNTYLDFEIPDTFPEPITLRNILTHTAGFEDKGDGLFKIDESKVSSLETYVKTNLPSRVFPPGKYSAYSNYASALSGYIIEQVTSMTFEDYIAENILLPLEMNHSTFEQPLPPSLMENMAEGYNYMNGEYIKGSFEFVVGSPAGALSASGLDMANFMIAHLQDGKFNDNQILSPELIQQMHSPLYRPDPRLGGIAYGFFFNTINEQYTLSHGGDTMLFHSQLFLFPESNVGIYLSTNGTNGSRVAEDVTEIFIDRYFPQQELDQLRPTEDFTDRVNQYTGTYFMARSNFTTFEKILTTMLTTVVTTSEEKILVEFENEINSYIEVEPGLLVNPDNPSDKLLLQTEGNQITLSPPSPFVFIKMPWYRMLPIHGLILVGGAILFLIAMFTWLMNFIRGKQKHETRTKLARLAHINASLFGIMHIFFITNFFSVLTDINPAYGVPNIYYGAPVNFDTLLLIPSFLLILGILMVGFSIIAWVKRFWTGKSRFFYSVLTLFGLAIIWSLYFWNLLL